MPHSLFICQTLLEYQLLVSWLCVPYKWGIYSSGGEAQRKPGSNVSRQITPSFVLVWLRNRYRLRTGGNGLRINNIL